MGSEHPPKELNQLLFDDNCEPPAAALESLHAYLGPRRRAGAVLVSRREAGARAVGAVDMDDHHRVGG
eukprot:6809484-Prymnesium_polylepis.2